jgi:hypothetical protein
MHGTPRPGVKRAIPTRLFNPNSKSTGVGEDDDVILSYLMAYSYNHGIRSELLISINTYPAALE